VVRVGVGSGVGDACRAGVGAGGTINRVAVWRCSRSALELVVVTSAVYMYSPAGKWLTLRRWLYAVIYATTWSAAAGSRSQ
jgi:hypothetical protein